MTPPSRFISFEGIDGCGKSTLMGCLEAWLTEAGIPYITTREPGGTALGERVRDLLLAPSETPVDQRAESLLYTASRAQLVSEVIRPALDRGAWVVSDRFSDATLAYQGFARGLDVEILRRLQDWATGGLAPHRTVLLDCSVDVAFGRMRDRNQAADRIESESIHFHRRVREGYLALARLEPQRFLVIDAEKEIDLVTAEFRERFRASLAASGVALP